LGAQVVAPLRANLLAVHFMGLPFKLWLERLLTVCVAQRVSCHTNALEAAS
jgi:hypothetical protein